MKNYIVVFVRTGTASVQADNASEARRIANELVAADEVRWDDDWPCADVICTEEENAL